MKTEVSGIKNYQVNLEDKRELFYSIRPFEIKNALGVVVAVLKEYFITNKEGDTFKLYKTNEGNWFDSPDIHDSNHHAFLRQLKVALDNQNP